VKLPNHDQAVVPREKIVNYLLSLVHRDGRSKALFFSGFGFSVDAWQTLADALLRHAADHEVAKIEPSSFGIRYIVEGELHAPDGRTPLVRVVWFIGTDEELPRLATAYPL
jgi:hypothetical protein